MAFDDSAKNQIAALLPRYITMERFISLSEIAQRSPQLRQCTPGSMLKCFIQLAEIGLEPNTPLGHAYIIPFRDTKRNIVIATVVIGWRGMVDKAIRVGAASQIVAQPVRQGELFKWRPVDPIPIVHEPALDVDDDDIDSIIGAYSVAMLPGGGMQAEWMSRKQVDRIRARSKAKDDGPWVTDFAEMARKCPTRRLFKYLNLTGRDAEEVTRLTKALELDNSFFGGADDDEGRDSDAPPALSSPPPAQTKLRGRPPKQQPAPEAATPASPQATPPAPQAPSTNGAAQESSKPEAPPAEVAPPASQPAAQTAQPAETDRKLNSAEYDELFGLARKLHPERTTSWLSAILEDNFGINDLSDAMVSQRQAITDAMTKVV